MGPINQNNRHCYIESISHNRPRCLMWMMWNKMTFNLHPFLRKRRICLLLVEFPIFSGDNHCREAFDGKELTRRMVDRFDGALTLSYCVQQVYQCAQCNLGLIQARSTNRQVQAWMGRSFRRLSDTTFDQ